MRRIGSLALLAGGLLGAGGQVSGEEAWGLRLAPDGETLLLGITRGERDAVGVLSPGGQLRELASDGRDYATLGWSGDQTRVLVRASARPGPVGDLVQVIAVDSGQITAEYPGVLGWFAPVGDALVIQDQAALTLHLPGREPVQLGALESGVQGIQSSALAWSPSGDALVFQLPSALDGAPLQIASGPDWTPRVLLAAALPLDGLIAGWSPSGEQLAVLRRSMADGHATEILLLDRAGASRSIFQSSTLSPAVPPAYSPDGQRIAFMEVSAEDRVTGRGEPTPAVVDLQGSYQLLAPSPTGEGQLRWSADGREVLLVRAGDVERLPAP